MGEIVQGEVEGLIHERCPAHTYLEQMIHEVRSDLKEFNRQLTTHREEFRREITDIKVAIKDLQSNMAFKGDDVYERIKRLEGQMAEVLSTHISRKELIVIVSIISLVVNFIAFLFKYLGNL